MVAVDLALQVHTDRLAKPFRNLGGELLHPFLADQPIGMPCGKGTHCLQRLRHLLPVGQPVQEVERAGREVQRTLSG